MRNAEKLYSALVRRNPEAELKMPETARRNVAPNGLRQVFANALQSSGDQTVNASTVLPWLFAALGVPAALTGLLVPIRESGSMLPQAMLTPLVVRVKYRKWILVVGALIQAAAVGVMAVTATVGQGLGAGISIIAALAVFSFGRCLTSIASKDVLGRTIPKGERGQINGLATTAAGLVAITLGLTIRLFGGENLEATQLAWLLASGAVLWLGVALVSARVQEPADETTNDAPSKPVTQGWLTQTVTLLRDDKPFRQFVMVRSLLLVSALSPPFIVSLSLQSGACTLAGLGGFVIASGIAALLGGRVFGRLADRSSSRLMSIGSGVASAIIIVTVIVVSLPSFSATGTLGNLFFITVYFSLTMMHTGGRVGRKTYIVDMAEGDTRTTYVAVSNSAMGIILLIVGAVTSALAVVHIVWALLFLAGLGLMGCLPGLAFRNRSSASR